MTHIWPLPRITLMPFAELQESRDAILVYSRAAYEAVGKNIHIEFTSQIEPLDATLKHWDVISKDLQGDVIYAVGGGLAFDAAKYMAANHNLPMVGLPTALSVDAFLTWASGYREDGCVFYTETKPPDELIIDFHVLASAPESIRSAGICDVLSIATGSWDWEFAEQAGKNPPETAMSPYAYKTAEGILQGAIDCAEGAGRGDQEGMKQLLDCLALEVQLCNQIGHARPEEGSEHYFAYSVENAMGKGLAHGDLVGPGIVLIAALQELNLQQLVKALHASNIPLTKIPKEVIDHTIADLAKYSEHHNLAYGIAHTLTASDVTRLPTLS